MTKWNQVLHFWGGNVIKIYNKNTLFSSLVFSTFTLRLNIELRCIPFPLIILEMFLQLDWNPPVVNLIDWTWFGKADSVDVWNRIVWRHRSGEGYQNISAALKIPKNTVDGRSLEPPLPRAGRPAKLTNQGRRALVREVTKNLMVTDRASEFLCGDGRTFQKDNHLCSTPPIRPVW
jgi:hypothetical protein